MIIADCCDDSRLLCFFVWILCLKEDIRGCFESRIISKAIIGIVVQSVMVRDNSRVIVDYARFSETV